MDDNSVENPDESKFTSTSYCNIPSYLGSLKFLGFGLVSGGFGSVGANKPRPTATPPFPICDLAPLMRLVTILYSHWHSHAHSPWHSHWHWHRHRHGHGHLHSHSISHLISHSTSHSQWHSTTDELSRGLIFRDVIRCVRSPEFQPPSAPCRVPQSHRQK